VTVRPRRVSLHSETIILNHIHPFLIEFHQSLLSSVGLERLTVIVRLSSEGPLFDSERGDFFLHLLAPPQALFLVDREPLLSPLDCLKAHELMFLAR
jgi:hypothetical protein